MACVRRAVLFIADSSGESGSDAFALGSYGVDIDITNGEFDPGSGRTLAAWIRHASRTRTDSFGCLSRVANG